MISLALKKNLPQYCKSIHKKQVRVMAEKATCTLYSETAWATGDPAPIKPRKKTSNSATKL